MPGGGGGGGRSFHFISMNVCLMRDSRSVYDLSYHFFISSSIFLNPQMLTGHSIFIYKCYICA